MLFHFYNRFNTFKIIIKFYYRYYKYIFFNNLYGTMKNPLEVNFYYL